MLSWFAKAIAQLPDPSFRRPLLISLAGALALLIALWLGASWALAGADWTGIAWLDSTIDALGVLTVLLATAILYPATAAAVLSLFLDGIVEAVEARHYPALPPARRLALSEQIGLALKPLAVAVITNLIALPLYLIPAINLLVFYGLNGYILGREYFAMVAARRLEPKRRHDLWREHRLTWIAMGVVIVFLSTLPVINLAAPIVAVAAATHGVTALTGLADRRIEA